MAITTASPLAPWMPTVFSNRWPSYPPGSGRLAQQRFLEFPVGRVGAQPDAKQRVVELGLLEGVSLRHALDRDNAACAGNPVDEKGLARHEFLVFGKDLAHAQ